MKAGRKPKAENKKFKCVRISLSPLAHQKYMLIPDGERSNRISKFLERIDPDLDVSEHGQRLEDPKLTKKISKKLKQKSEKEKYECNPKRKTFHVEHSKEPIRPKASGSSISVGRESSEESLPKQPWEYSPVEGEPSE